MKTRIVIGVSLMVVVLAMANLFVSHAQQAIGVIASPPAGNGAPPLSNPLKVALLKWYDGNAVFTLFPVGPGPQGVAFDGANIWVVGSNLVKIRASDGTVLGTFGTGGDGVTFDGADLWVTSGGNVDAAVTKVRASDGKVLG